MLTEGDVVSAYRLLLGRPPESKDVVDNFMQHANFDTLRTALLGSKEFAARLSCDLSLLGVPTSAILLTAQVRSEGLRLQHLASARLPLRGKSVLIAGKTALNAISFFLDRECSVSVVASRDDHETLAFLQGHVRIDTPDISAHLASTDKADARHADVVYADMPHTRTQDLRRWLKDVADVSGDLAVVNAECVASDEEDLFLVRDEIEGTFAVPTRRWLEARLEEEFPHVYRIKAHVASTLLSASIKNMLQPLSICAGIWVGCRGVLEDDYLEAVKTQAAVSSAIRRPDRFQARQRVSESWATADAEGSSSPSATHKTTRRSSQTA